MSRNLRQRAGARSSKKTVRRGSTSSESSDDSDYAGVDLITDSEEDEPDVEVAEEQAIIQSVEKDDNIIDDDDDGDSASSTPRPSVDDDQSSWDGFDITSQEDVLGDNADFFNESITRMNARDDADAGAWNTTSGMSDDDDTPSAPRHVRFDLSDSSSGLSDNDDDIFPDIFMDQSKLDPTFRKAIEAEDDEDEAGASSDEGSYWDFQGSDVDVEVPAEDSDQGNESDSSTGSSGYESGLFQRICTPSR